jgi:putative Ig domain-containing protein
LYTGNKFLRLLLISLFIFNLSGCGQDFVWFVSWNTGQVQQIDRNGLVVVVGTPRQDPPKAVSLVDGEIPKGMKLMEDGTVRGIPEESGRFDFTIEITNSDGTTDQESIALEITD